MDSNVKQAIHLAIVEERERTDNKFQRLEDKWQDSEKQQAAMNQKLNDLSEAVDKISIGQNNLWNNINTLSVAVESLKESSEWVKRHLESAIDGTAKQEGARIGSIAWKTGTGAGVLYVFTDQILPHISTIVSALGG